jgi:hypothetical protein
MKLIAVSLFCLVALPGPKVCAQTMLQPVDVPNDARSIATGESFTGLPANPSALMYNPAGLAGLPQITAYYCNRAYSWVSDESYYTGANLSISTPLGVFAAQYNRFFWYTQTVWNRPFPGDVKDYDIFKYDIALGFARSIFREFSIGIAVKYFGQSLEEFYGITATPAWLFDGGLLYSFGELHSQRMLQDKLTLGLSVQNIGTKYKILYAANEYRGPLEETKALPQYLRLGVSYSFKAFQSEENGIIPLAGSITGEWRRAILNSYAYTGTDYGGCGAELIFFEVLSIRGGRIWNPYNSVYSDDRAPSPFRYGAGISIPLEKFGVAVPFTFSANYTVIPLWRTMTANIEALLPWRSFDAFSFEAHYTGVLW